MKTAPWKKYAKVVPMYHFNVKGGAKCGNTLRPIDKLTRKRGAVTCFLCEPK